MPCGGIYTIHLNRHAANRPTCFQCGDLIWGASCLCCEEVDSKLHYYCLGNFLVSKEGKIILKHNHQIHAMVLTDSGGVIQ
jgi:hypothetical protein